jgi:hypothetical protein
MSTPPALKEKVYGALHTLSGVLGALTLAESALDHFAGEKDLLGEGSELTAVSDALGLCRTTIDRVIEDLDAATIDGKAACVDGAAR